MATTTTGITINGMGNTVDIRNLPYVQGATATFNPSNDVVTVTSGNEYATLTENNAGTQFAAQPDGSGGTDVVPVCFASGTRIATSRGAVVVEELRIGDAVMTASGAVSRIAWIGHRRLDCRRHPSHRVQPVRISAHAFAQNRPSRDLRLSPGHAVCVDVLGDVLIPVAALVNGATIVQENVDAVIYWHVALEGGHDVLMAEDLPCESYLDMGNGAFFEEAAATALQAAPDARVAGHEDFCRPFHKDGPVVDFVRQRLADRAGLATRGLSLRHDPYADVHLIADGRRLDPETRGLSALFVLPTVACDVWVASEIAVPAHVGGGADLRSLGVCVHRLVIDDGFGEPRTITADSPFLGEGFHDLEAGPQRWTAGNARLPAALWEGCKGSVFLRIDFSRAALPRWVLDPTDENVRLGPPRAA